MPKKKTTSKQDKLDQGYEADTDCKIKSSYRPVKFYPPILPIENHIDLSDSTRPDEITVNYLPDDSYNIGQICIGLTCTGFIAWVLFY